MKHCFTHFFLLSSSPFSKGAIWKEEVGASLIVNFSNITLEHLAMT